MDLLRTVANGCERLRTVADGSATSSEHTLNPQTPRVKREPLLRIREKSAQKVQNSKKRSHQSQIQFETLEQQALENGINS